MAGLQTASGHTPPRPAAACVRRHAGLGLAALAAALVLTPAAGQATPPDTPDAPAAAAPVALADRVRAVLDAHCPDCKAYGDGAGLDLAALAENPGLVVPGRPDASRIYQRLLARQALPPRSPEPAGGKEKAAAAERSHDTAPPPAGPDPAEVEAVRDWIEALPARDAHCRDRNAIAADEAAALIARWVEAVGTAEARDTRFVSLVHLWNACVAPQGFKALREATVALLSGLARKSAPVAVETLGDASAILAVRPSALAMLAGEWERLTAGAPAMHPDAVPADWLAAHLMSGPRTAAGAVDPAFDVRFDGADHRAVAALARAWQHDVDLVRAAAERAVSPHALAETLSGTDGDWLHAARRLLHGALPRSVWQRLAESLDGRAGAEPPNRQPVAPGEIDVVLWSDKPRYRQHDLVTLSVSVGTACHLTLIGVDGDGRAIVLFPNEMEPDNLIAPSVAVQVPGREAGYQLRLSDPGTEDVIAICRRQSRDPDGIAYDYERQRFAMLGDWRAFLRTASEREKEIRAREAKEATRRRRRGRTPPAAPAAAPAAIDPAGPAVEGRAAIRMAIDAASTAGN